MPSRPRLAVACVSAPPDDRRMPWVPGTAFPVVTGPVVRPGEVRRFGGLRVGGGCPHRPRSFVTMPRAHDCRSNPCPNNGTVTACHRSHFGPTMRLGRLPVPPPKPPVSGVRGVRGQREERGGQRSGGQSLGGSRYVVGRAAMRRTMYGENHPAYLSWRDGSRQSLPVTTPRQPGASHRQGNSS